MTASTTAAADPVPTDRAPGTSYVGAEKSFELHWQFTGAKYRDVRYIVSVNPVGKGSTIASKREFFRFVVDIPAGGPSQGRSDKIWLRSSALLFNSWQEWEAHVFTESGEETLYLRLNENDPRPPRLTWSQSRYNTPLPQLFYLDKVSDGLFVDVKPIAPEPEPCPTPDPSPFPTPRPPGPIPPLCGAAPQPFFGSS